MKNRNEWFNSFVQVDYWGLSWFPMAGTNLCLGQPLDKQRCAGNANGKKLTPVSNLVERPKPGQVDLEQTSGRKIRLHQPAASEYPAINRVAEVADAQSCSTSENHVAV